MLGHQIKRGTRKKRDEGGSWVKLKAWGRPVVINGRGQRKNSGGKQKGKVPGG